MIIYFLIALLATLIGSAAGMGGGVIIKPLMDLMGDYNVVTISVLSSITVFSMAVVSTIKQLRKGFKVNPTVMATTAGAVLGGIVGSMLFSFIKAAVPADVVTVIQSAILIILLSLCLLYKRIPQHHIHSVVVQGLIGLALGMMSSFLGIGGGPINVAVLCILFGIDLREAARVSVFIILFSQMAGLIAKGVDGMFAFVEDFRILLVMIPAAIVGGMLGPTLNHRLSDDNIGRVYNIAVVFVMLICGYNIMMNVI